MNKKRILFISSYFPNSCEPNKATYIKQILIALTKYYQIDAIVPIPWYKRFSTSKYPFESTYAGINSYYPAYYYTPGIFRPLYGYFYYLSIIDIINRLSKANNYDFIYSVWLYPDAWVASKVANNMNIPLYVKAIGSDVNRLQQNSYLTSKLLEVEKVADRIIAVSNPLKNKMIEMGCKPDKLVYLQNGVDHKIFYPSDKLSARADLGIAQTDKIILFVGNLKKEKGLDELADAFAQIVKSKKYLSIKLIIIGDGNYRSKLIRQLTKFNLNDNLLMLGELPLDNIAKYMNACDVLCLPSYMEGQPNVVIEALTCHTKVVSTAVGGIPDLDDGNGNLMLVPPRTVVELTGALVHMLDDNEYHTGSNSIYSWDDYAFRLKNIFEQSITRSA